MINKRLEKGLIQSFFLNEELVDRINISFFKFDNWVSVIITDEITTIRNCGEPIDTIEDSKDGNDEFRYPIELTEVLFPEFEKYLGKKLIKWRELVLERDLDLSFGINLYFENNVNLIIYHLEYPEDENKYIFENRIPKDLIEK